MAAAAPITEPQYGRAVLYHQGLPIALCPVTALDDRHLDLGPPPWTLERDVPVCVDLYPGESFAEEGLRLRGRVEETGVEALRIRVETVDPLES